MIASWGATLKGLRDFGNTLLDENMMRIRCAPLIILWTLAGDAGEHGGQS